MYATRICQAKSSVYCKPWTFYYNFPNMEKNYILLCFCSMRSKELIHLTLLNVKKKYVFKQETCFIKILQKCADVLNQYLFPSSWESKKLVANNHPNFFFFVFNLVKLEVSHSHFHTKIEAYLRSRSEWFWILGPGCMQLDYQEAYLN